jgi:hypothetical protein
MLDAAEVDGLARGAPNNMARPASAPCAANVDDATFTQAIERIRDYIAAGDTYQVNYTYRLRFDAFGDITRCTRACARASRCPTAPSSPCPTDARCCRCRRNCSCATTPAACWRAR